MLIKKKKKTKVRAKTKKKTKVKKNTFNKIKNENGKSIPEVVIKTKPEWIKNSLASKSKYQEK